MLIAKIVVAWNIVRFKMQRVQFGKRLRVRGCVGLKNEGSIEIGNDFACSSGNMSNAMGRNVRSYIKVEPKAFLKIGNNVGISSATLWCATAITLEDNVKIGAMSIITDTDAHSLDPVLRADYRTDALNAKKKPVLIKENAFVGACCFIGKGVTIGRNSIVGAGAVVTRDIPDNEIWAGNPAQFVRRLE